MEEEVCLHLIPADCQPSLHQQPLAFPQLTGKWFYIASAFRLVEFRESAKEIQATFFHLLPNHTEDVVLVREYMTM